MSEFITKAREQILIYWMLVFYFLLFTTSSLASCALASLIGSTWNQLDGQGHLEIILAVFVNWAATMMAFFNKAASKLKSDQLPISPDDGNLISSRKVTTESTQQVTVQQTPLPPTP